MIELTVSLGEGRGISLELDAPYSPDLLDDLVSRMKDLLPEVDPLLWADDAEGEPEQADVGE
jgi:hypothetical protein